MMMKINQHLGIIGGGQLGKMMILEAKKLGIKVSIYDPDVNCPAHSIADHHRINSFDNHAALKDFVRGCDLVTYEFEHIAVEPLKQLENEGMKIYPSPSILEIIQDKLVQKKFLEDRGLPIPEFYVMEEKDASFSYPFMLKTRTGGYDGKGNFLIHTKDELDEISDMLDHKGITYYGERLIDFKAEISVIVSRNEKGQVALYPVAHNIHEESILRTTIAPAEISKGVEKEAKKIAEAVVEALGGIGIFCIELFLTKDEEIMINEIAPRPHNSGHYTIEACQTSQFEQVVRAVMNLPLGDSSLIQPAVMINLIGDEDGTPIYDGLEKALALPAVNVHIYGKEQLRKGRKMGHITVLGDTLNQAMDKAKRAKESLTLRGGQPCNQ